MDISTDAKREIIQGILESDSISRSKILKDILAYLLECSINNTDPHEYDIASNVLHKEDYDPSIDTSVRVHLHKLRQILENYHFEEARYDSVYIGLPKGQYGLKFITRNKFDLLSLIMRDYYGKSRTALLLIFMLISVILLVINLKISSQQNLDGNQNNPFWSKTFTSERPIILALGDRFFYKELQSDTKRYNWVRDYKINSSEEFEIYESDHPSKELIHEEDVFFFSREVLWPLQYLLPSISSFQSEISFKLGSKLSYHDFNDNDVIYIGSIQAAGVLSSISSKLKIEYDPLSHQIIRHESPDSVTIFSYDADARDFHKDYSLVSKVPGPGSANLMMLTGSHASGITGVAKYITQIDSLKVIEQSFIDKYGYFPQNYQILFKISGFDRSAYTCNIVSLQELSISRETLWQEKSIANP